MGTLATINGEALAVPGLRFWRKDCAWPGERAKVAIIASDSRGAAEVWTYAGPLADMGGVELHSPIPTNYSLSANGHCEILDAECWSDGSLIAWNRDFMPLVAAGDSEGVLRELARWHDSHFGSVTA